jgi:putative FmdB family regulatory protein
MPLYEYRCHRCDKTFEIRQKFAEAPLKVHEGCGGDLERIIFASALQFKGSGFYVNDYGRGGKSPAHNGSKPKPESKTESKSESKTESKSESKPESKSESKSQDQSQSRPADSTPSSEK